MINVIVARSTAKWNSGRCRDCNQPIPRGDPIVKIAEDGPTTKHGQGPGRWVCSLCSENYPEAPDVQQALFD